MSQLLGTLIILLVFISRVFIINNYIDEQKQDHTEWSSVFGQCQAFV